MPRDLADQLDEIARAAKVAADVARSQASAPPRDWLDQIVTADGDVILTDIAAFVLNCHRDTARSYAAKAAITDKPIAYLYAGTWWFSEARLLDSIEAADGLHARLAAQTRANELRKLRHKTKLSTLLPAQTESPPSKKAKMRAS